MRGTGLVSTEPPQSEQGFRCGNKKKSLLRGVLPPLQTLAVKAVVTQRGEDPIHGLVHPLQAHRAFWQLGQIHHGQAGALRKNKGRQIAQHPPVTINKAPTQEESNISHYC